MSLKLHELSEQYRALKELGIDVQTGEIELSPEEFIARLDSIKDSIGDKAENLAKWWIELQAEIKAVEFENARLQKHKTRLSNQSQWIRDYLLSQLTTAGLEQIKKPTVAVYVHTNPPSVEVTNEDEIEEQFKRIIPEHKETDKKAILDWYKETKQKSGNGFIIKTDVKRVDIK